MIEQFEKLEAAINGLEACIEEMKKENERLKKEAHELRGVIDDRDLEILQLQEDAEKRKQECEGEKAEISNRLQMLLGRVQLIGAEENKG